LESTGLKTRRYKTIPESSITAAYIPSLIRERRRVEFWLRGGRKLIQRHGGSAARRCARLALDWAGLAGGVSDAVVSVFFPGVAESVSGC
jgi:hypothetical protein